LDKEAMGRRIRQIRKGKGLRQWELAQLLGTTQSAVHKYEHGVIPEPRRLVELSRIGGTSVEWVLTGEHWENGSTEQERLTPDILRTAVLLREVGQRERDAVLEALGILREAIRALQPGNGQPTRPEVETLKTSLRDHSEETLRLLESAWRIQRGVLRQVTNDARDRLSAADQAAQARDS
jgi:transcriptional regulator with XRE-family HTH domain